MTLSRISIIRWTEPTLLMAAASTFGWITVHSFHRGDAVLHDCSTYILVGLLTLPIINIRARSSKVARPIKLVCTLVVILLASAACISEGDAHPYQTAAVGRAAVFFLLIGTACWHQLRHPILPPAPAPAALNAVEPPGKPTPRKKPPTVVAAALNPASQTPPTDTEQGPTVPDLIHLMEDFLYSRNRISWSKAKATEIQSAICQLFATNEEMMTLAADLAQYHPSSSSELHSYPAMKPKIDRILRQLRDPDAAWRKAGKDEKQGPT